VSKNGLLLICCLCYMTGLFFQWVCCIAIWMVGFVLNGIRLFPQFYPLAMLGGFLWCTGTSGLIKQYVHIYVSMLAVEVLCRCRVYVGFEFHRLLSTCH